MVFYVFLGPTELRRIVSNGKAVPNIRTVNRRRNKKKTGQKDQCNWVIHDSVNCTMAQRIVAKLSPAYTLEIGVWASLVNSK